MYGPAPSTTGMALVYDPEIGLGLLALAVLLYAMEDAVDRVEGLELGYLKYTAITVLGFALAVVGFLLVALLATDSIDGVVTAGVYVALFAFLLLSVVLMYPLYDDWAAMLLDPDYSSWLQVAVVVGLFLAAGLLIGFGPV